jgi:cysteine-rich repeat protein
MRARHWLMLLSLWGCNVFDDKLEQRLDHAQGKDAGSDAGEDAGPPPFMLANRCSTHLPEVTGAASMLNIPITGLTSDVKEGVGDCDVGASVLVGADGFFQIHASAGDRWHFHMNAAEGQNLALLASSGCDLRECVAASDVCGVNESEHFTFIPEKAGDYVVMVDGINPKHPGNLSLLAVNPTCGDDHKEHSEVCDDGNVTAGDGCDPHCRAELHKNAAEETEPNDDSYGANVLMPAMPDQPVRVRGKIAGGACQPDYYLARFAAAGHLNVQLLSAAGQPCTDAPPLELSLTSADTDELREAVPVGHVENKKGKTCPVLDVPVLAAGTYFVRVHHLKPAEQFEYRIDLTFTTGP